MKTFMRTGWAFAFILTITTAIGQSDDFKVADMFSNHMVIQRDIPIKIWGEAKPGAIIKVTLDKDTAEGKTSDSGKWELALPARTAGGPYTVTVSTVENTVDFTDVLIGDIWVCSGQSNMEFKLRNAHNSEDATAKANNFNIRLYQVPKQKSATRRSEFISAGTWNVCTPKSAADFSAVGYFFGKDLQHELEIPIGLIESSWGGTRVEWWTPLEGLRKLPFYADIVKEMEKPESEEDRDLDYNKRAAEWMSKATSADPGTSETPSWFSPEFNDSSWKTAHLPATLDELNYPNYDGSIWFRRQFELTPEQASSSATLVFPADDADTTYINGQIVGNTDKAHFEREYKIPAHLLKAGNNSIAIQLWDWGGPGGIIKTSNSLTLVFDGPSEEIVALAGDWNLSEGISYKQLPKRPIAPTIRGTVLYNAMIAPLQKFGIKGFIWYQGESNARVGNAEVYDQALATMIQEWRKGWNLGDLPFFQVQLAGFTEILPEPAESDWAVLRESQENLMRICNNTAMASALDVGDQFDIHPTNKETVGKRLALNALALTYKKEIEYMGPIYKSHSIAGNQVTIQFDHAETIKTPSNEKLQGFSICGQDGKFVWADAEIKGNQVIVSNSKITSPVAVRYGWANYSVGNLYNGAGLPASPFRTDNPKLNKM